MLDIFTQKTRLVNDLCPTWSWWCQRVASETIFSSGSCLAYCNFPSGRQSITAAPLNHSHLSFMTYWTGWSVVFPVLLVMVVKAICHNKFTSLEESWGKKGCQEINDCHLDPSWPPIFPSPPFEKLWHRQAGEIHTFQMKQSLFPEINMSCW